MMWNSFAVRTPKWLFAASLSLCLSMGKAGFAQPSAPTWPAPSNPAKGPTRDAALARLLKRLDSAPVQWEQLNLMAQQGDELSNAASLVSKAVAPIRPYLVLAANSQTLAVASHLPLVGVMARSAQDNLSNLVLLEKGFQQLIKADQRHLGPLRAAAQSAAKLQHSRSADDVPAVARNFGSAAQILSEDATTLRAQRTRLTQLQSKWPLIESVVSRYAPMGSLPRNSMAMAKSQLSYAMTLLDDRLTRLTSLRLWLKDGAADARSVSGA